MQHSFDIEIAAKYGVEAAVILNHLQFWIRKNQANHQHFHDGLYWTYNSVKALSDLFPYLTPWKIRSALEKLEKEGLIIKGNFSGSTYNRTLWYAISEKGNAILQKPQMDLAETANAFEENDKSICGNPQIDLMETTNRFAENHETITDITTDITQIEDTDKGAPAKAGSGPDFSATHFSAELRQRVEEWLQYKRERREQYKPMGLKSLLTEIQNKADQYGEPAVIELIGECMADNYRGIIWAKLRDRPGRQTAPRRQAAQGKAMPETANGFARYLQRMAAEGEGEEP